MSIKGFGVLKKIKVPEKWSRAAGIGVLKIKEASPEILLGAGVICMGAAIVSAVKAARQHDYILADHEERLEAAKCEYVIPDEYDIVAEAESGEFQMSGAGGGVIARKSEKEVNKAIRKCYGQTAWEFTKLYSSTIALSALSLACFVGMHNIQARRITGLNAAYTGLREYIKRYEERNIELNGQKSHEMCKYGYKEVEVTEEDPDTGEMVTEKKKVPLYEGENGEKWSDETTKAPFHNQCIEFSKDTAKASYTGIANYDLMTLNVAEQDIKDLVRARGWAVKNDLYDILRMERTPEGMIEGWVHGCGPEPDLGIHDPINNRCLAGFNHEDWVLDPNIHGNVYALLREKEEKEAALEAELKAKRLAEEA